MHVMMGADAVINTARYDALQIVLQNVIQNAAQAMGGGGQIDVFVEASGFAANLNLKTNGNKQNVQIDSKGEIRGVKITMTKT